MAGLVVGAKRKAPHDVEAVASGGEEDEVFDDEGELLRTVFVENVPLRTKKKALTKEFTTFGVVDSVRIRSVPIGDGMEKDMEIKSFICRANDMCKGEKRQMINAEDVFKALEEIEFPEFVEPLRTALEGEVQSQV